MGLLSSKSIEVFDEISPVFALIIASGSIAAQKQG